MPSGAAALPAAAGRARAPLARMPGPPCSSCEVAPGGAQREGTETRLHDPLEQQTQRAHVPNGSTCSGGTLQGGDLGARWLVGQQLPELRLRQRALRGAQRGRDTLQRLCERARAQGRAACRSERARSHSNTRLCDVSWPRCAPRRARCRRRSSGSCCPTSQRAPRSASGRPETCVGTSSSPIAACSRLAVLGRTVSSVSARAWAQVSQRQHRQRRTSGS